MGSIIRIPPNSGASSSTSDFFGCRGCCVYNVADAASLWRWKRPYQGDGIGPQEQQYPNNPHWFSSRRHSIQSLWSSKGISRPTELD